MHTCINIMTLLDNLNESKHRNRSIRGKPR